ncbi:MAG: DNA mismatch repair endonuclease MutL [Deltaproteobacteria bacterium]|nr:DNA mismatch repair endonuclease MutL [Deltaproteobacteria bacterium]
MKPKIHILPEELCNKIAAGEVVERPSSVVKELVENSLDAGAANIIVELESGGKRLIRVTDDGCGMNRQDAFLSFERHSTSKIFTDTDLFALRTLGFRGEALASIASVSRLKLKTCDNDNGLGQLITAEGGRIKQAEEIGSPRGTLVEVRNLFFNLPARKKFLRKEQTELGHAADVVTKQALANPRVSFRLQHNERILLDLRREKGLPERVAALLGRSLLKDLLPLEYDSGADLKLRGLISQPQLNRSAGTHIYTFINGRYIRDRVVQHAVMEGYRHLLMKGRYPVAVLFLEMDPAAVDVNVHPTKHEVRFREQSLVHDFIAASLKKTLSPAQWVTSPSERVLTTIEHTQVAPQPVYRSDSSPVEDPPTEPQGLAYPAPISQVYSDNPPAQQRTEFVHESALSTQYVLPGSQVGGFFSQLQILGQYHQSYILCQDGDDLVLIDQHAGHERVGFEKLRHFYHAGAIPVQALLFPEILDLDFNSAVALEENLSELRSLGFELEPFGGKSFALKAVPQLLGHVSAASLVVDIALELERIGRTGQLRDSLDEVLILMACHGVIRANQALSTAEIKALFVEMDKIDFKANCPHGRPVLQRMRLSEVERLFRRQ